MATGVLSYMIVMTALGVLMTIATIGQPRKAITPGWAATYTAVASVHLVAYVYLLSRV